MKKTIIVIGILILVMAITGYVILSKNVIPRKQSDGKCLNNLRQIAAAIKMYAADNGGLCPTKLKDLEPKYMAAPFEKWGICPVAGKKGEKIEYLYLGAGKKLEDISADHPLVADRPDAHGEGGNVVYADGRYEWISKDYEGFIDQYKQSGKTEKQE